MRAMFSLIFPSFYGLILFLRQRRKKVEKIRYNKVVGLLESSINPEWTEFSWPRGTNYSSWWCFILFLLRFIIPGRIRTMIFHFLTIKDPFHLRPWPGFFKQTYYLKVMTDGLYFGIELKTTPFVNGWALFCQMSHFLLEPRTRVCLHMTRGRQDIIILKSESCHNSVEQKKIMMMIMITRPLEERWNCRPRKTTSASMPLSKVTMRVFDNRPSNRRPSSA